MVTPHGQQLSVDPVGACDYLPAFPWDSIGKSTREARFGTPFAPFTMSFGRATPVELDFEQVELVK